MEHNSKLQIYKGIIQYLLESTNYNLKNIADLTNSSIKNIRSIYCEDQIPLSFKSELQLVKIFSITLEININKKPNHKLCKNKIISAKTDLIRI